MKFHLIIDYTLIFTWVIRIYLQHVLPVNNDIIRKKSRGWYFVNLFFFRIFILSYAKISYQIFCDAGPMCDHRLQRCHNMKLTSNQSHMTWFLILIKLNVGL